MFLLAALTGTLSLVSSADIRTFLGAEPVGLFVVLCAIVAGIYALSEARALALIFNVLPCVFWIYFVPMLLATFGLFPEKSPVYGLLTDFFCRQACSCFFSPRAFPTY